MAQVAGGGPFAPVARPELLDLPDRIVGPRVLLRAYRPDDDAAGFAALSAHRDELMQWMSWPSDHQTVLDTASYVRRMAAKFALREVLVMGIWDRVRGAYLGGTGFHAPNWQVPSAEFGYFLLPPARGKGLATEALKLVIDYGFPCVGFNRIWGDCDVENTASAAVMQRAGLQHEATMRHDTRDHHGKLRTSLRFSLGWDEYPAWHAARAITASTDA
jgi:RimJ/RimL family protein N-acetyltransferase